VQSNVKYLRKIELAKLPQSEREEYNTVYNALRKQMRSIIAHQDSPTSITGRHKYTINSIIGAYGLKDNRSYANTKIMSTFAGEDLYKNEILPIYQAQREYNRAKGRDKKNMQKAGSPMDYMDLATMYYFYKFRSEIVKAYEEKLEKGGKLGTFDGLIEGVYKAKFSKPTKDNMFYSVKNLGVTKDAVSGFVNVDIMQNRQEKNAEKEASKVQSGGDDIISVSKLPITEIIKADVMHYMISYVEKTKDIDEAEFGNMTPATWYTLKSVKTIATRNYNNAQRDYMLGKYNFCEMDTEKLLNYYSKAEDMMIARVDNTKEVAADTKIKSNSAPANNGSGTQARELDQMKIEL